MLEDGMKPNSKAEGLDPLQYSARTTALWSLAGSQIEFMRLCCMNRYGNDPQTLERNYVVGRKT